MYNVFLITSSGGKTYLARNVTLSRCEQAVNDLRRYYDERATPDELDDLVQYNWELVY